MDEQLRERIADIIVERENESPLERADAILQIPEIAAALALQDDRTEVRIGTTLDEELRRLGR